MFEYIMRLKLSKSGKILPKNENQVLRDVLDFLNWFPNIKVWRQNNHGLWNKERNVYLKAAGSINGVSDILGFFLDGSAKFLAIEVKQPGENPTEDQLRFLKQVNDAGGVGFVARGIDDVEKHLGAPGYQKKIAL